MIRNFLNNLNNIIRHLKKFLEIDTWKKKLNNLHRYDFLFRIIHSGFIPQKLHLGNL